MIYISGKEYLGMTKDRYSRSSTSGVAVTLVAGAIIKSHSE